MIGGAFKNILIIFLGLALIYIFPLTSTADWHIEVIDSDDTSDGESNSLVLDGNNNPSISYRAYTNPVGDTKYAYHDGITWQKAIIDPMASRNISLSLNNINKPSIVYANDSLKYAWCESVCDTTWEIEYVTSTTTGDMPSSHLDSSGMPHVSYLNYSEMVLEYTYRDETGWVESQVIDSGGDTGYHSSLDLDSEDNAHISYYGLTDGFLKYATNASGDWVTQLVDSNGVVSHFTSLALDSEGNAHISYHELSNGVLKYATNASGDWITEEIDRVGTPRKNNFVYTSIALDSDGKTHISYYDFARDELKYVTNTSGDWLIEIVDSSNGSGDTALALDSHNKPHISYYFNEEDNGDLKYAKKCFDMDSDCDDTLDNEDNCPNIYNSLQEDTCPPQGNGIGDACDCEGNFDCDQDCDGTDASVFKTDFGRSLFLEPCNEDPLCKGNFDCDLDVDGTDASMFKNDFGRSPFKNPCPTCVVSEWCTYP